MNRADLINDKAFWDVLESLLSKDNTYTFNQLESNFQLSRDEIMALGSFLKNLGIQIEMRDEQIQIKGLAKFQWSWSIMDWIAFQVHFPFMSEHNSAPYHQILKRFLSKQEDNFKSHNFFEAFSTLEKSFDSQSTDFIQTLEKAILERKTLRLKLKGKEKNIFCYPYRMSYLQDELALISEDSFDRTLISIPMKKMAEVSISDERFKPHHNLSEVINFISNLRQFSESEDHLILKIYQPGDNINLNPDYHYFRNASLLRSSRGDYIWSAYVERGDRLYEWLEDLWKGCRYDVLAPTSLSEDFDRYLHQKMSRLKKAS